MIIQHPRGLLKKIAGGGITQVNNDGRIYYKAGYGNKFSPGPLFSFPVTKR